MINYFYQCELSEKSLFEDENPDVTALTFISRPFMTAEAMQESIIKDFSTRLSKKKDNNKIEVTSIKEVSPYRQMSLEELEKRIEDNEEYRDYVETWDGPDGPDSRFTFVNGVYHDPETQELDLKMPPTEFLARYTTQSYEDNFVFPSSQFAMPISSTIQ